MLVSRVISFTAQSVFAWPNPGIGDDNPWTSLIFFQCKTLERALPMRDPDVS